MDILCEINPMYRDYMVTKGNQKVHHMSYIQNASLSCALLLQADQGTTQLWLWAESI